MAEVIRISGLRELNAALKRADVELPKKVRISLNAATDGIAAEAARHFPRVSGRGAATYKSRSTRTASRVAMGGTKARYVPWMDFGGQGRIKGRPAHRPFIRTGRYLFPALERKRPQFVADLERVLVEVAVEAGFEAS